LSRALYLDTKMYLQDDILVKTDRASMACSLEVRAPFLDVNLVEFASRLPSAMKLNGWTTKYLLKKALRGLVPDRIIDRPKKGFGIPLAGWIRKELKGLFYETLSEGRLKRHDFFNPRAVAKLLEDHMALKRDNRKTLWTLFVFESWYSHWVNRR